MNRKDRRRKPDPVDVKVTHHTLTEAQNKGAARALEIVIFVLLDKLGWDRDQVAALMKHVADQAQAVTLGYVSIPDIVKVLRDEYQIEV